MERQEILEKLEKTNDVRQLNKLLKKIDFSEVSIEELECFKKILDEKDDIYQLYPIRNIIEGVGSFAFLLFGASFVGLCFIDTEISMEVIKEIYANKMAVLGSVVGASGAFSVLNELVVPVNKKMQDPTDRELEKYYKYKEMVILHYNQKLNEKMAQEEEIKNANKRKLNVKDLQDFFGLVNSKLMSLPDNVSEKYVLKANTLVMTYNEKCRILDKKNSNDEAFMAEVKELYLDELIKGLENILNEILPIINSDSNTKLVIKITDTLNDIINIPNSIEAVELFVTSIDKVAQSLNCLDVNTFNKVLNIVVDYILNMLKKEGVNAKSLMFRLNPYFYKPLGDKIKVLFVNNSEALGEISNLDGKMNSLTPFNYINLLVDIYLKFNLKIGDNKIKKIRGKSYED